MPSPDYALYLQFPDDHNLDTELCNIDVSEENIVLTLHKLEACKGLWDSFHAGFSEENLEVSFVTFYFVFVVVVVVVVVVFTFFSFAYAMEVGVLAHVQIVLEKNKMEK